MRFAERLGFVESKTIQTNDIDDSLRNRLYNAIYKYLEQLSFPQDEMAYVVDKLGRKVGTNKYSNWRIVEDILLEDDGETPWYMPYEVVEYFIQAICWNCSICGFQVNKKYCAECKYNLWIREFSKTINAILEEEKSGYRLIDEMFVNIVDEIELDEISTALNAPYESVRLHFKKALSLYSDRQKPDYENSIKESISAVEAMCCILCDLTGSKATLGAALRALKDNGIIIHGSMESAFEKLYGYTSDASGIRHGGIDFKNAPPEDAKYMLISCSAFVNYLIEKHRKIEESNNG